MPEHLKALVIILFLASLVFAVARRQACTIIDSQDFVRRRNAWYVITLLAFLAHNYWLFALFTSLWLGFQLRRESNRVALFFTVLFAVPLIEALIPGFGVVNALFSLNHLRILALVVLMPTALEMLHTEHVPKPGALAADKLLIAFLLLTVLLELRETTITDALRKGVHSFLDFAVPYYVISRSLRSVHDFKAAMLAFVLAMLVLAAIAVYEAFKHWHLYDALVDALGLNWGYDLYLDRAGILRAHVSTGQPIALGFVLTVGIGFWLFLQSSIADWRIRWGAMLLLAAGLLASVSRGPWIGAVILVWAFLATGPRAVTNMTKLALSGIAALAFASVLPGGGEFIDTLPIIGTAETYNIDYRQRLIDASLAVIDRNPWFGSVTFASTPEMQAMIQGQGLIDVVNTYLLLALEYGYVGMGLFVAFFLQAGWGIYRGLRIQRRMEKRNDELILLGRVLLATLLAVLLMIFTTSKITVISIVMWSVGAMGVAYAQMVFAARRRPEAVSP